MQEAAHPTARVLPWMFAWGGLDAGSTVAAKAGADAPGGGISLCFCRRGCAAPAQKAATLNAPPRSSPRQTSRHAQRPATLIARQTSRPAQRPAILNEKARLNIAEADNSLFYLSETGRTDRPEWRFEKVLLWSKFPP